MRSRERGTTTTRHSFDPLTRQSPRKRHWNALCSKIERAVPWKRERLLQSKPARHSIVCVRVADANARDSMLRERAPMRKLSIVPENWLAARLLNRVLLKVPLGANVKVSARHANASQENASSEAARCGSAAKLNHDSSCIRVDSLNVSFPSTGEHPAAMQRGNRSPTSSASAEAFSRASHCIQLLWALAAAVMGLQLGANAIA